MIHPAITENLKWLTTHQTYMDDILREHTTNTHIWDNIDYRLELKRLLAQIPPVSNEGLILYSGAEIPISNIKFGQSLNLPYFTSSYDRQVAEKYANMQSVEHAGLLVIHVPVGSKIVCLDHISSHGDAEHEVLLWGKATLQVRQIIRNSEYVTIHVDYLDDWSSNI
jgi:hypothetical protein